MNDVRGFRAPVCAINRSVLFVWRRIACRSVKVCVNDIFVVLLVARVSYPSCVCVNLRDSEAKNGFTSSCDAKCTLLSNRATLCSFVIPFSSKL